MDILLTHGYYLDEDPQELAVMKPYPPLGILYLSAYLKACGFQVGVFDTTFSSLAAFRETVQREKPPVVGLYSNLITRRKVVDMARFCKSQGAVVVIGGPEAANYPAEYLDRGADVIVVGEGEHTLEELLPHLARHGLKGLDSIPGLIYRPEGAGLVRTPARPQIKDLDGLPFPDRSAIDLPQYVDVWRRHHGAGSVSLITARGCPYTCTWCSHSVFGYTHRRRSPGNVAAELAVIMETYRPEMVWYADDVFTIHHRWLYAYQEELRRRELHVPFETISREDRLDEKVVQTLAEMGCYRLWIGAESGSQEILDAMSRRTDAARVARLTRLLQRHGIQAGMFIMLGYEGERLEHLEETVALLKKANPDTFLTTVAYPIKGTPYYEAVADRVIPLKPWGEGSDRDLTVSGRYSARFYAHATRWMRGEVAFNQARHSGNGRLPALARHFINAKVGRLGMRLSLHERQE